MCEEFLNEVVNEVVKEKYIKEDIFRNYFKFQKLSFLVKDLFKAVKNKNGKINCLINNEWIKLMKDINIKKISKNEIPKKLINIVKELFSFNERMLQKLQIALALNSR